MMADDGGSVQPWHVLLVANRTSSTPSLIDEVRRRAQSRPHRFTLMIPDAEDQESGGWTLLSALPLLERAAGTDVPGLVRGPDPVAAIREAAATGDYDEILISTRSRRTSKWLRRDLPHRVRDIGVPIAVLTPEGDSIGSFIPSARRAG